MRRRPWKERVYESILISRPFVSDTSTPAALLERRGQRGGALDVARTDLSVAICSLAIELRSSWLVAAEVFVSGVLAELPLAEPVGVEPVVVEASVSLPLTFADCLAAFSARRFCFEAEGAMAFVSGEETGGSG